MSEWQLTSALAVTFALPATSFAFVIDAVSYTASIAAGSYRIALAAAGQDILRMLEAAMLGAPGLPGDVTITVSISGETGLVSIGSSVPLTLSDLHTTRLGRILGYDTADPGNLTQVADRQPWYLGLFVSAFGGVWSPRRSGARERDAGGRVFTFAGSLTSYDREITSTLIPWSPERAAEAQSPASPMYPTEQYLEAVGATSTGRAWGLVDLWTAAGNATCALALGDWQEQRGSTTARYIVGQLATDLPNPERQDERWHRYVNLRWVFVRPTANATGTRA